MVTPAGVSFFSKALGFFRPMDDQIPENFSELGLDSRLVKALAKSGIQKPTLIQSSGIPFGLQGKDVLAKAKTGSGKTLAYLLPVLHRLLTEESNKTKGSVRALILVPSRDLAKQVMDTLAQVMIYCPKELRPLNLAAEASLQLQKSQLASCSIVVGTPSRVLPHLGAMENVEMLVIDEADLILGFGYGGDMEQICAALPQTVHSFLMSASITAEVEDLKELVLRNAVTLKLEDPVDEQQNLKQFTIETNPEDKYLLIYVVLKLKLLKGKILIFVNDVDKCYRLKLFLEQFGIRSCAVNAELPLASRHHIVEEFNRGVYDLLIASDQSVVAINQPKQEQKKKGKKRAAEDESGMARGIDFKRIDVVLNFDFPSRFDSYIHRVGRTARAGAQGTAISFVTSEDAEILGLVSKDVQDRTGQPLSPYSFDMTQIEGFRYRCQDALRAVTGATVKEARLKDLKKELINSAKLKTFFEERPKDLELLKHDKELWSAAKMKPHLKHVPEYLVKKRKLNANDDDDGEATEDGNESLKPLPQTTPAPSNRQLKGNRKKPTRTKDPLKSIKKRR